MWKFMKHYALEIYTVIAMLLIVLVAVYMPELTVIQDRWHNAASRGNTTLAQHLFLSPLCFGCLQLVRWIWGLTT